MKITTPTLLLDWEKAKKNIERMVRKANDSKVRLAPHFKTHQSLAIGRLYRDHGIKQITVSSVRMAKYFISDGWKEVFIAVPVNIHELDEIEKLSKSASITILVSDLSTIQYLEKTEYRVYIEVDNGYHRSGLENIHQIETAVNRLEEKGVEVRGLYCHDGNTYASSSKEEIIDIHRYSVNRLNKIQDKLSRPELELSVGDTPSCSVMEQFDNIDVIRPGNFVFYDLAQTLIGSCNLDDISIYMACPVIAVYPERSEAIIYGGGVHFSKDVAEWGGNKTYGLMIRDGKVMPESSLVSISQEHGKVKLSDSEKEKVKVGDVLYFLPVHSCMTADKMGEYYTLNENNRIDHLSGEINKMSISDV